MTSRGRGAAATEAAVAEPRATHSPFLFKAPLPVALSPHSAGEETEAQEPVGAGTRQSWDSNPDRSGSKAVGEENGDNGEEPVCLGRLDSFQSPLHP